MEQTIPSAEQVRAALRPLSMEQLERLAVMSGVPAATIYKIKRGETRNPGVETVRQFLPHVDRVRMGCEQAPGAIGSSVPDVPRREAAA